MRKSLTNWMRLTSSSEEISSLKCPSCANQKVHILKDKLEIKKEMVVFKGVTGFSESQLSRSQIPTSWNM